VAGFDKVLARMAILRIVAAPHVTTRPAQPQMNPGVAHGEALLAAVAGRGHGRDGLKMGALLRFGHIYIINTQRSPLPPRVGELRGIAAL
jgi:hypothetical protein